LNEVDCWMPLEILDNDPNVTEVQGELHVRLRYKMVQDEEVRTAVSVPTEEETTASETDETVQTVGPT